MALCLSAAMVAAPCMGACESQALASWLAGQGIRGGANSQEASSAQTRLPFRTHPDDELTRSGLALFYNMDYDAAIAKSREEMQAHPDDPFVVNHALAAILAKELNREGAFDAALYTGNRFMELKPEPVDPKVKAEIVELAEKAQALATSALKKNPNDTNALYARAAARGYEALFYAVVEKRWLAALRHSLGSYHDDEEVLKLDPNNSDAKFIVGSMLYVVGGLSWYERMMAFVISLHGNKKQGLQLLREAANGGGAATMDARMFLSLFLAREKQYEEPIALMRQSYAEFPRNFIYGFSEAELLAASGERDAAISTYRELIAAGEKNQFPNARSESAAMALGELFRKAKDYKNAAEAFDEAAKFPHPNNAIVAHCDLEGGQMYDLLGLRETAVVRYDMAQHLAPGSDDAREAERYLRHLYEGSE
ncbi:MAG TPA: tetratricopeptide repeat protein [Candidatus Acidoferrales bacterium]|nr:tetratricopeptide repeat protein [Candidatus Acidoferrales bacterium]